MVKRKHSLIISLLLTVTFMYFISIYLYGFLKLMRKSNKMLYILLAQVTCYLYFQLKGTSGYGVEALKRHPKVRSVTPQKRVERFLRSVQGNIHYSVKKTAHR